MPAAGTGTFPWKSWNRPNSLPRLCYGGRPLSHYTCRYVLRQFPPTIQEMRQLCNCGTCVYNDDDTSSSVCAGCNAISLSSSSSSSSSSQRVILRKGYNRIPDAPTFSVGQLHHGIFCTSKVLPERHFVIYWSDHSEDDDDEGDPDDIHCLSIYGVTDDDIWSFVEELFAHVFDHGATLYFCGLDYSGSGTNDVFRISADTITRLFKLPHRRRTVSFTNICFDTVHCGQVLGAFHGRLTLDHCIWDTAACHAFVETCMTNRTMTGLNFVNNHTCIEEHHLIRLLQSRVLDTLGFQRLPIGNGDGAVLVSPELLDAIQNCPLRCLSLTRGLFQSDAHYRSFLQNNVWLQNKDTLIRLTLEDLNDNDKGDGSAANKCQGVLASVVRQCQRLKHLTVKYSEPPARHWFELMKSLQCHPTMSSLEWILDGDKDDSTGDEDYDMDQFHQVPFMNRNMEKMRITIYHFMDRLRRIEFHEMQQIIAPQAKMNWYRKRIEKLNCEEDPVRGGLIALALAQGFQQINRYRERMENLCFGTIVMEECTAGLPSSISLCYLLVKSNAGFLASLFPAAPG